MASTNNPLPKTCGLPSKGQLKQLSLACPAETKEGWQGTGCFAEASKGKSPLNISCAENPTGFP